MIGERAAEIVKGKSDLYVELDDGERVEFDGIVEGVGGASLGIAGLQMQTLFKNPLADPFALGVSSGASSTVR